MPMSSPPFLQSQGKKRKHEIGKKRSLLLWFPFLAVFSKTEPTLHNFDSCWKSRLATSKVHNLYISILFCLLKFYFATFSCRSYSRQVPCLRLLVENVLVRKVLTSIKIDVEPCSILCYERLLVDVCLVNCFNLLTTEVRHGSKLDVTRNRLNVQKNHTLSRAKRITSYKTAAFYLFAYLKS